MSTEGRVMGRTNKRFAIGLLAVVAAAAIIEFQIGDFLYDTQSSALTPIARTLLVVLSASLLMIALLIALERILRPTVDTADPGRKLARSRVYSVVPLVRGVLLVVVVMVSLLVGLSEFGVDIGPMLASAGVLGIALGLGAQSLMRDILAGTFFVAEDAFRVGEYVEIGTLRGTVEKISLRSMKVRHHRGALHTIPYGSIPSLTNYSRDWVIVKFELQVPHDTDVIKLKRIVKKVSAEINENPEFKRFLIEPLKSQGVDNVDLFGLTIRLKFMAVPGEQFTMRREMLRRLTEELRENGIELARRSVHVEHPHDANAAASDDEDEPQPPTGQTGAAAG